LPRHYASHYLGHYLYLGHHLSHSPHSWPCQLLPDAPPAFEAFFGRVISAWKSLSRSRLFAGAFSEPRFGNGLDCHCLT
jgi:hypothetical protein